MSDLATEHASMSLLIMGSVVVTVLLLGGVAVVGWLVVRALWPCVF